MYNEDEVICDDTPIAVPHRSPAIDEHTQSAPVVFSQAFVALGLNEGILKALAQSGYTTPTPVQTQAIPACIEGRDLLVSSQTGSGKTAAFMLPALHRIALQPPVQRPAQGQRPTRVSGKRPRPTPAQPAVLVLTPTRELALQVTTATATYGKYLRRIECGSVLGGMPYPKQLAMLSRMPDILVATPGRLLDHIGSGRIDLSNLQMLVFDEADRMLDMGFSDDIDSILEATPDSRQTVMFSATLDSRVAQLAARMLNNPLRIEITGAKVDQSHIEQRLHYTDDINHKQRLLDHLLRDADLKQAIVFTATKREAEALSGRLSEAGFSAGALHGDMHQGARNRTLTELRRGGLQVLVATDVAARGIDVPDITHVVNFDLPKVAEDYVHRIGRTGRAGRSGIAINLVGQSDIMLWVRIERLLKRRIDASVITGLEPRRPTPKPSASKSGGGGGGYRGKGAGEGYRGNKSYGNSNGYRGNSGGGYSGNTAGSTGGGGGYGAQRNSGYAGNAAGPSGGGGGYGAQRSSGYSDRSNTSAGPSGDRRSFSDGNRAPRTSSHGGPARQTFGNANGNRSR
ncbi:MAG: DEAD/DEAH box helicase [Ottowia sp.]|nr:DEAD/DEAH box helicase [Ottowia sp.]